MWVLFLNINASLLSAYESTERPFGGSIEARVLSLREQHKGNLDKLTVLFPSHINAQSKSKLMLLILDYIKSSGFPVSSPERRLYRVLNDPASLKLKSVRGPSPSLSATK